MTSRSVSCMVLVCLAALFAASCSKPKSRYPPRVDLASFGTLGMIEFSAAADEGLGPLASREFLASLQSAQPGTPVLELGDERTVLAALSSRKLDVDAIRAIGEKYRVDALVVGALLPESVQPNVSFDSAVQWMSASAALESGLNARILDTRSGATVWSTATRARAELARVDVDAYGVSSASPNSPDDARLRLVRRLVQRATCDFYPYWE